MVAPARVAVVGAGLIGQAHINRILAKPYAKLAGIADPSPQSKAQAEGLGVAWAPDIETRPDGVAARARRRRGADYPDSLIDDLGNLYGDVVTAQAPESNAACRFRGRGHRSDDPGLRQWGTRYA